MEAKDNPLTPPTQRELRKPYFIIRTPDRVDSFLERDNARLLLSPKEPLSRFLAPAKLVSGGSGGEGRIEYDLSAYPLETFAPLKAVPTSLMRELREAVEAFYTRADDSSLRVSAHERELRRAFRVPDPDLEPDAYWVYGPREDRRLLILWGCEAKAGTSLPLRSEKGRTGLLGKLADREMGWQERQQEALRLIAEKDLPLSRFIGEPTYDRHGKTTGLLLRGKKIPLAKLKPLRHISARETTAFETAAEAFYADAHDSAEGVSGYEKELRRSLKLPDPAKHPKAYFVHGRSLVILVSGHEPEKDCLHPLADAALGLPPAQTDEEGRTVIPPTVADFLREHPTPVGRRIALGAAAALLLIGAVLAYIFTAPDRPPEIAEIIAQNDPRQVEVVFNMPVDTDADDISAAFRLRGPTGAFKDIKSVQTTPGDRSRVRMEVAAMQEGREYILLPRDIVARDRSRTPMPAGTEHPFRFEDTLPPELGLVSADPADARRLILVFNEPVDPRSVSRGGFEVAGFNVREARVADERPEQVRLTVDRPFEDGLEYSLVVRELRDASSNRNPIEEPIRAEFRYLDRIPPAIEDVHAGGSQFEVRVRYSKTVEPASASTADNYLIEDETGAPVRIRSAGIRPDGVSVNLVTAPLSREREYRLLVEGVHDRADPPNTLVMEEAVAFRYTGTPDTTPPALRSVTDRADDALLQTLATTWNTTPASLQRRVLLLSFNKPVPAAENADPGQYTVPGHGGGVERVEWLDETTGRALLLLDTPLQPGTQYAVRATSLTDWAGITNDETESPRFTSQGVSQRATNLRLEAVEVRDARHVVLRFNLDLHPDSAANRALYFFNGGNSILRAEHDESNAREVTLVLDGATPLQQGEHTVTARDQQALRRPSPPQHDVSASFRFQ